jgi:hypothetical protein
LFLPGFVFCYNAPNPIMQTGYHIDSEQTVYAQGKGGGLVFP